MVRWVAAPPAVVRIGFPFQRAGLLVEDPGRRSARRHYAPQPAMGVDVAELYWGTTIAFVEQTKQNEIAGRLQQAFFDTRATNAAIE